MALSTMVVLKDSELENISGGCVCYCVDNIGNIVWSGTTDGVSGCMDTCDGGRIAYCLAE